MLNREKKASTNSVVYTVSCMDVMISVVNICTKPIGFPLYNVSNYESNYAIALVLHCYGL